MEQSPHEHKIMHSDIDTENSVPSLEQQSTALPQASVVMRPGDAIHRRMMTKIKTAVASGLIAFAGSSMTDKAQAGGIPGLEDAGKAVAVGILNGMISQTPFGVRMDNKGVVGVVAKSPQDRAMNVVPRLEPGVLEYANAIGINVINEGLIFQLQNQSNPIEEIHFKKYHNPTHYTTGLSLRKAQGGGLLLSVQYVQDNFPKAQLITIRTNESGKMTYVKAGD